MSSQRDKHLTRFDLASQLPSQKSVTPEIAASHSSPTGKGGGRLQKSQNLPTSQGRARKILEGKTKELVLPSVAKVDIRAAGSRGVSNESPWNTYKKVYNDNLAGPATIVVECSRPSELRVIRTHKAEEQEKMLQGFRGPAHRNIVSIERCFKHDDTIYVLHEHLPLSLESLVGCPAFPNEIQLASILGQIIEGLLHIESSGFHLDTFGCSDILLGMGGEVKIWKPNYNRTVDFNPSHHVRPLGIIAMELMEGESDEERVVGIKNLRRWPSDSDAVDFLSTTTSAGSLRELQKHQLLLEQRWNRGELVWLFLYTLKKSWNNCSLGN